MFLNKQIIFIFHSWLDLGLSDLVAVLTISTYNLVYPFLHVVVHVWRGVRGWKVIFFHDFYPTG